MNDFKRLEQGTNTKWFDPLDFCEKQRVRIWGSHWPRQEQAVTTWNAEQNLAVNADAGQKSESGAR